MARIPQRRKVLVLKDEPSIQKLFNFMGQMRRENAVKGGAPLARVHPKQFDTVIIDLWFRRQQRENEIHGIGDIRLSSIGKMLAVTFEVNGPKTAVLVERHLRNRLTQPLLWLICNR